VIKRQHLLEIDALRGIAALVVALVFHQHYLTGDYRTGPLDGLLLFSWLHKYGWTMVDLFFVISGFVFAHVYFADGRMRTGAKEFAVSRFARLYPLHIATLVFVAILFSVGIPDMYAERWTQPDVWHFLLNALMLHRSGLETDMSFNVPTWSIAAEVYCYFAFYLLARFLPRYLPAIAVIIVIGALAISSGEIPVLDHLARGFGGFFAGVLTFRWGKRAPAWLLVILAVAPLYVIDEQETISNGLLLGVTAFPAWVLLALHARFLRASPLQWLGQRSYSIYLLHAPIYWTVSIVVFGGATLPDGSQTLALLCCSVLVLLAAHFSYRYFEEPARSAIRSAASRSRQQEVTRPQA